VTLASSRAGGHGARRHGDAARGLVDAAGAVGGTGQPAQQRHRNDAGGRLAQARAAAMHELADRSLGHAERPVVTLVVVGAVGLVHAVVVGRAHSGVGAVVVERRLDLDDVADGERGEVEAVGQVHGDGPAGLAVVVGRERQRARRLVQGDDDALELDRPLVLAVLVNLLGLHPGAQRL
jgi:hypothetical protein